jgi:hypothetical protein
LDSRKRHGKTHDREATNERNIRLQAGFSR